MAHRDASRGLGNVSSFDRGKYLAVILARDRRAQVNNVIEDCAQRVDISRHGRALSRNLLRGCKCWGGVKHVYAVWTRCAFAQTGLYNPTGHGCRAATTRRLFFFVLWLCLAPDRRALAPGKFCEFPAANFDVAEGIDVDG